MKRCMSYMLIFWSMGVLGGCGHLGVKPWERDLMARRDMQLGGEELDAKLDDHVYFSKEASSGGRSFGGGGCGCN